MPGIVSNPAMLCGEEIRTGFISGNQRGFYYLVEAEYDDPVDDFSEAYFR